MSELHERNKTMREYLYAVNLATYLWDKYYKNDSPEWEPLDDTLGVLTQIDNMIYGLDEKLGKDNN